MRRVVCHGSSAGDMHWNVSQAIQLYDFTDFIHLRNAESILQRSPFDCPLLEDFALRAAFPNPSGTGHRRDPCQIDVRTIFHYPECAPIRRSKSTTMRNDRRDPS